MTVRAIVCAMLLLAARPALAAGDAFVCPQEALPQAAAVAGSAAADTLFSRAESTVPAAKRTTRGLYLTAADAFEMVSEDPSRILFIDVRTRGELQFIGMPTLVDAHIPFMLESQPAQWDEANQTFKLVPNPTFVADVGARLSAKGLAPRDTIVVLCQGGLRAARAANALTQAGYANVYTVIDGFEGDPVAEGPHKGERTVNGWRNAGLPWTTRLDRTKMYGLN